MSDLIFTHVRKEFSGGVVAVEDFSLVVPNPRMVVLVGPSGCGKTTLLRMVAGLETLTSGEIHLGQRRLDTVLPRDRDIAMGVPVMIESGRTVLAWGRGSGCDETDIRGDHEEAVNHSRRPALLFVTALPQIPASGDGSYDKEPDEPRP